MGVDDSFSNFWIFTKSSGHPAKKTGLLDGCISIRCCRAQLHALVLEYSFE
jgi:hypothetical protein